jgi:hypothetical protein
MIRAYYAADEEMTQALHKKASGYKGMSAAEIAETDARIDAYYAAFREAELRAARQEALRAAEDCVDAAELERRIEDTLKRLYTDEDLHHRMLVYKADAIARKAWRGLPPAHSAEKARSATKLSRGPEGGSTRKITKAGPTGLIVTTTATGLDVDGRGLNVVAGRGRYTGTDQGRLQVTCAEQSFSRHRTGRL